MAHWWFLKGHDKSCGKKNLSSMPNSWFISKRLLVTASIILIGGRN